MEIWDGPEFEQKNSYFVIIKCQTFYSKFSRYSFVQQNKKKDCYEK